MTYVLEPSAIVIPVTGIQDAKRLGKDDSLNYILAFAAVGLFFSILSFALTPTELLPEGAAALAPEMQTSTGLRPSEIEIPAALKLAEYSTH
jgi:hypothetical protein